MQSDQQFDWLDTETRSILSEVPPSKESAADLNSYSLLLLKQGDDRRRIEESVAGLQQGSAGLTNEPPSVVARGMTLDEALAGQFALACCDCVSAFVVDEVADQAEEEYLSKLYDAVKQSTEFESVNVEVRSVPNSELGRKFSWQFLGLAVAVPRPCEVRVYRKKARLMQHWAARCGVQISGLCF